MTKKRKPNPMARVLYTNPLYKNRVVKSKRSVIHRKRKHKQGGKDDG